MRGVRQTYRDINMIHEAGDCDDLTPSTNMLTCEFELFSNEIIETQIHTDGIKVPYCYRILANLYGFSSDFYDGTETTRYVSLARDSHNRSVWDFPDNWYNRIPRFP